MSLIPEQEDRPPPARGRTVHAAKLAGTLVPVTDRTTAISLPESADHPGPGGSRAERIYNDLKAMIVSGALGPGVLIDKGELCQRYSASKLPITIAINRLALEELVLVQPQHGSFVAPIRFDDIRQLMALRLALETDAVAALLAGAGCRTFLAFAGKSLAYQHAALAVADLGRFYELDAEMHRTMIHHSGLPKFNNVLDGVRAHLDRVRRLMQTIPGRVHETMREHEALVAAIASGDPARAIAALREHLERAMQNFVGFSSTLGPAFAR